VAGLRDHGEAALAHPVDEPQLPQRLRAVEALREDAAREAAQLGRARRGRQGRVADVVAGVEVRVVDPDRTPLPERRERELLAVAGNEGQAALELGDEVVVGRGGTVEDHAGADVHVGAALLEREERGIERAQSVRLFHALHSRGWRGGARAGAFAALHRRFDNLQHCV
jgi:hypothetical protein